MATFTTIEQVAAAVQSEGMAWHQGGTGASRRYEVRTKQLQTTPDGKWTYNTGKTVCEWTNKAAAIKWANDWLT
jgi:hypothetical protein